MDPHTGLGDLSRSTGGFLVRDTNDLQSAFRRIEEDMQFHYVLTYEPSNQAFDGRFREVDVKVRRPGARVFARRGYFAVRSLGPSPILGYEALPLAALDRAPLPNAFPVRALGLSFPEPRRPGLTPVVVRVGTDVLAYDINKGGGTYSADATILVRFKDEQNRVVHKTSQHYLLSGRLGELDAARRGEILFYRQPELLPGAYTIEAMVFDGTAGKGSARVATLVVPGGRMDRTRLSSVVVVDRAEPVEAGNHDPAHPLYVGDLLLYPRAGAAFVAGRDTELTFFFAAYPATPQPPSLTIELLAHGRVLSRAPVVTLPAPDGDGRIQQVQRIPIGSLDPGPYELRVTVDDGTGSESRTARFVIAGG
jgi:hypothetical protein